MTQLEALRLADMLENNYPLEPEAEEAAAELRRLHEENEQLRQALAQPEQEPVAWRNTETGEFCTGGFLRKDLAKWMPLYTALPKREWVGLTDEERFKIARDTRPYVADTMRAHEEELKRRNT